MRIILNASNLKLGGAFQRFVSVLEVYRTNLTWQTHVVINDELNNLIDKSLFPKNFIFYNLCHSPAKLSTRYRTLKRLNNLERKVSPDVIFSWVGPAYWKPRTTHLVGFGLPHLVYNDLPYVKSLNIKEKVVLFYKRWWTIREADYYVVQTDLVKTRLSVSLGISLREIFVVHNGPGSQFMKKVSKLRHGQSGVKKLLMLSTYRPSKNFEILLELFTNQDLLEFDVEIHLTIKDEIFNEKFPKNSGFFVNHGPTNPQDCPELYAQCDAMILPSHLECFSASYVESMYMGVPILTSDLPFAKDVCAEAALFFDNTDVKDLSQKVNELFRAPHTYAMLVDKGKQRLKLFHNAEEQARLYLKLLNSIV